jgi:hypothetical protein
MDMAYPAAVRIFYFFYSKKSGWQSSSRRIFFAALHEDIRYIGC